jgi:hypothetical protein
MLVKRFVVLLYSPNGAGAARIPTMKINLVTPRKGIYVSIVKETKKEKLR